MIKSIYKLFLVLMVPVTLFAVTTRNAKVDRVVDGDTIWVIMDGERANIRFLGVDTPEINFNGKTQGYWGETASEFTKQILPKGTPVTLEFDLEEKDKYGRYLAHVWKNNESVNGMLIEQGLAITYVIYPNLANSNEYRSYQIQAIKNKSGFFNSQNPLKLMPFEFRLHHSNRPPDKFVGNMATGEYFQPNCYQLIPIPERIFFMRKNDADEFGMKYNKKSCPLPDFKEFSGFIE